MNPSLLSWDERDYMAVLFLRFFTHARTEDGKEAIKLDSYLPLVAAMLGMTYRDAFTMYEKLSAIAPPWANDNLMAVSLGELWVSGQALDGRKVSFASLFTLKNRGVYTQRLVTPGHHGIDVSLPYAATLGYLSLFFSHLHLKHYLEDTNRPTLLRLEERIDHYLKALARVAAATAQGGTLGLLDYFPTPALRETLTEVQTVFCSAMQFLLLHELAHIKRDHHALSGTAQEKQAREFDADQLASEEMRGCGYGTKWFPMFGSTMVLVAISILSSTDDDLASPAHPPLVDRFRRLCQQNDRLLGLKAGASDDYIWPYIVNIFSNLWDRDRCPAWFGQTRREVLGLPEGHQFSDELDHFQSMKQMDVSDHSKTPAKSKKLL